jgi:hypothetical protein
MTGLSGAGPGPGVLSAVCAPRARRLADRPAAGRDWQVNQRYAGGRRPQLNGVGRLKILVAGWDSGGGVEAVQTVVGRAVARGHQVRVLGTEGLRSRFESAGATFLRYKYAPDNDLRQPETDLVKDWQTRNPLSQWRRVRDRQLCGPAREFCRDVAEELQREAADVAVVDTMIPAAMFGAEVAGVRAVIVMHGPYMIPRPDVPPLGWASCPPGGRWAGSVTGPPRRSRSRSSAAGCRPSTAPAPRWGCRRCGTCPVSWPGPTGSWSAPAPATTSGPVQCRPMSAMSGPSSTTRRAAPPAPRGPARPLVLVGLSSTVMRQEGLLQRAADALGPLPVRGLVTTGPAVDPAVISAPGQCHGHPVGTPRRCASALLGGDHPRRSRHRDEGLDRRRPAGPGAAGARPARQRRAG